MERSWISLKRTTPEFRRGVEDFIQVALTHRKGEEKICCPCKICGNMRKVSTENELREHIFWNGFSKTYTEWIWHGEGTLVNESNNDTDLVPDSQTNHGDADMDHGDEYDQFDEMLHDMGDNLTDGPPVFESLLSDAETPLYTGCTKYSRLTAVLKLFKLKAAGKWSDKSFTNLLEALKDMLPEGNELPSSTYQGKKLLCPMGLDAEKIHACPRDCVLYRKECKDLHECPKCGTSRYKVKADGSVKEGSPAKVMWYLPIVPRLKRLYANVKDARNLTWHADRQKKDELIRHVADSPQWKLIDNIFPDFHRETRNLRLGVCTDGINPFSNMSSQHSIWPVLLVNYNLPPWLCMKRRYLMLSCLISGPKQPGNDICVYLVPLLEDLKKLWDEGVPMYDAYREESFTLRAMLYCTINDFPAYGNLSGNVVKGYKACPICEDDTKSIQLKVSKKLAYLRNRTFLPRNHPYRRLCKAFDGKPEHECAPKPLTGKQVYDRVKDIQCEFGKPYKYLGDQICYKKKCGFWILPYWEHLHVRHCIDLMHVEKNVFDSLIGTLLNMPGKTKDGKKARGDMEKMGIRPELKATKRGKRHYLPPACYTLSKKEKRVLCEALHGVKVPHGYSSNIRNLVSLKDLKLVRLKSHDCHTLIQEILPVAIRSILPKQVRYTIIRFCLFFKAICSKALDPGKLDSLQAQVIVTLCQLEMYFPPSFFDIMVHLVVHLVREIKLCGPIYLRYMYPFERAMGDLKGYVRNRSRPEGSIIEGYLADEVLRFCTDHLEELEAVGFPNPRHNQERVQGIGTIGRQVKTLSQETLNQAYMYILQQIDEVQPYFEEHMILVRQENHGKSEIYLRDKHNRSFIRWFKERVNMQLAKTPNDISEDIRWLAFGPDVNVTSFEGYDINGYCFSTKRKDDSSTMQNSGVSLVASALHFASAKDNRPQQAKMSYYGIVEDIFELDFIQFKVPLFKCKWVDIGKGVDIDDLGYTRVNFNKLGHHDEPFIMASQAKQVFYMADPSDTSKSVVIQGKKQGVVVADLVPDEEEYDQIDEIPAFSMYQSASLNVDDSTEHYLRDDHNEGVWVTKNSD